MKTLEIIHLRLAGNDQADLVDIIRNSVGPAPEIVDVRIYRNYKVKGDLAIHLHRETGGPVVSASEVGIRLAALLKDLGMVAHTIWSECCIVDEGAKPDKTG